MEDRPHPRKEPRYPVPLNHENLTALFAGAADFSCRTVRVGGQIVRIYSLDGIVSSSEVADFVIGPLLSARGPLDGEKALGSVVPSGVGVLVKSMDEGAEKLVSGFCLCLFSENDAVAFEARSPEKRAVSAPTVENTIKGAKDAFTETLRTNTGLLRRHLRLPELRLREEIVGRRSLTTVTVCSVEGLTNPAHVEAVLTRLRSIDIDGLLTPAALEEYLTGSRRTAFPLLIYTERADRFAWGLLAGRVGVLAEGLPLGYLLPCGLPDFLESPEDRSGNYQIASAVRLLRWVSLGVSLLLPGLFAAMCLFHQEMIPLPLLRAIEETRRSVPLSTGAEVLMLLLAFEILQEAGLQLPKNLGQAVSIIGGLVVGTAAVEASLISPASLIAVAASGVCSFTLPQRDLADGVRIWRFLLALAGVAAGLAGVALGFLSLLVHLSALSSLGVPWLSPMAGGRLPELRSLLTREKHRKGQLEPRDIRNQR